ncbi:MAG: dihydrofolate reductase [Candidatus Cloacimonetes bacterium]|nr:dihydrofolate reductase [Candidatus Cloacimonadota bacterium]
MNIIVAVDEKWGIGKNGDLLIRLPEDMKFFRIKTTGNTIIMGRITFESLPDKKPLPNRNNIVLSSQKNFAPEGVVICNSIEEVLKTTENDDPNSLFIIGGGKIYQSFLPHCNTAYVTKIFASYDADTSFHDLDKSNEWQITEESDIKTSKKGVKYQFITYKRITD